MQKYKKNEKSIIMLTVFYTQKSDIQASDIKTCKKIISSLKWDGTRPKTFRPIETKRLNKE